ncbi:MAG TPA: histidine phosphatase family protein [Acidimicrobiia bacterium]|nr:histidine phosphatase family protein [Acidimicrobiia bacterium]
MPTFVLVRHAKAERSPRVADLDRALADRGRSDAALIGAFLAGAVPHPRALVSSPARRARETAERVAAAAGWNASITVDDRLYGGSVADLLAVLAEQRTDSTIAFGHEPVWSATISAIVGGGTVGMVTAAAACIEGEPEPGGGVLRWMIVPAALGGGPS